MTKETQKLPAGWGYPTVSNKWHYFPYDDTFSLCRKIGFYFGDREEGVDEHSDNCAACKKKLAAMKKKAAKVSK